jgi:hypothetical protein
VKDKEAFSGEADESVGHDQLGLSFNLSLTMDEIKQRAQGAILIFKLIRFFVRLDEKKFFGPYSYRKIKILANVIGKNV